MTEKSFEEGGEEVEGIEEDDIDEEGENDKHEERDWLN